MMIRRWLWLAALALLLFGTAPTPSWGSESTDAVCAPSLVKTDAGRPIPIWLSGIRFPCGDCPGCHSPVACLGDFQGDDCDLPNPGTKFCYSAKPAVSCQNSSGATVICCVCHAPPP